MKVGIQSNWTAEIFLSTTKSWRQDWKWMNSFRITINLEHHCKIWCKYRQLYYRTSITLVFSNHLPFTLRSERRRSRPPYPVLYSQFNVVDWCHLLVSNLSSPKIIQILARKREFTIRLCLTGFSILFNGTTFLRTRHFPPISAVRHIQWRMAFPKKTFGTDQAGNMDARLHLAPLLSVTVTTAISF